MSLFGPTKEKAQKALAKAFQTGNFSAAITQFTKLIKKDPDDYESLHNLGYALLESNRTEEAIESFIKANELHEDALHWNNLGRAYQQLRQFNKAKEAYAKAMELDSKDPKPWYNLTVCLREMGKMDDSFAELNKLLEVFPDHTSSNNDLALHLEDRGKINNAVEVLEKALNTEPNNMPARMNLIRMLCNAGKYPDSTPHLEFLAEQGANVEISALEGNVKIVINGAVFYEGTYKA